MILVISFNHCYIEIPSDARFVYSPEFSSWNTSTFAKSLNQTLVFQTHHDSIYKIRSQETRELMVSNHLINHTYEYMQFYNSFSRIIFRPRMSIVCKANKISSFKEKDHQYSVQLRAGGNTANSPESATFLPKEKWNDTVMFIQKSIKEDEKCIIYISSDSDQLLKYTISHLRTSCKINYMREYQRGHSALKYGGNEHEKYMMGAMYELIVLSRAKSVMYTPSSSFGRFAVFLCQCKSGLIRV